VTTSLATGKGAERADCVAALYDQVSELAAERLRELLGSASFDALVADEAAVVHVTFDLDARRVGVGIKWPREYGDKWQFPIAFTIPAAGK
jgi:hypothetical protein